MPKKKYVRKTTRIYKAGIGRPPEYSTEEAMQERIDDYFKNIVDVRKVFDEKTGDFRLQIITPPTMSGLAYHLGYCSRQSLYDNEHSPTFSYIIKRARAQIESFAEEALYRNNVAGAIFVLKNMGWTDKQEIDQTVTNIHDPIAEELRKLRVGDNG